jgi:hypothetical protein
LNENVLGTRDTPCQLLHVSGGRDLKVDLVAGGQLVTVSDALGPNVPEFKGLAVLVAQEGDFCFSVGNLFSGTNVT